MVIHTPTTPTFSSTPPSTKSVHCQGMHQGLGHSVATAASMVPDIPPIEYAHRGYQWQDADLNADIAVLPMKRAVLEICLHLFRVVGLNVL